MSAGSPQYAAKKRGLSGLVALFAAQFERARFWHGSKAPDVPMNNFSAADQRYIARNDELADKTRRHARDSKP